MRINYREGEETDQHTLRLTIDDLDSLSRPHISIQARTSRPLRPCAGDAVNLSARGETKYARQVDAR